MAKFYSDIELEVLLDDVAEAIASRDVKEWPKWIVVLTKQIDKKRRWKQAWVDRLLDAIGAAYGGPAY